MDDKETSKGEANALLIAAMPGVFVLLWSTGFLGAKMGMPHAEPFTFLAYRFSLTALGFALIAVVTGATWPKEPMAYVHAAVIGVLLQAVYLGGVFFAVANGTSAGISALIVGVQPILTAILAGLVLGERLRARAWVGLALGFVGVGLVVGDRVEAGGGWIGISACVAGLIGITVATIYQKRYAAGFDLRVGSAVQFAAAGLTMAVCAVLWEQGRIDWTGELIFALVWLIVVLSFGAITLFNLMIRRGAASKVASVFYLVPPVVAVEAYFLFGETIGWMAIAGMALAVIGVAMVTRP